MAFYTCSHSGMRSEVIGGGLGVFFSGGVARTNSCARTRFLHWTSMQRHPHIFSVGAAEGCDLLMLICRDQKIAACGSSYRQGSSGAY